MVLGNINGNSRPRASSSAQNNPVATIILRTLDRRRRDSTEAVTTNNTDTVAPRTVRRRKRKLGTHLNIEVGVPDERVKGPTRISLARKLMQPEFAGIDLERIKEIDAGMGEVSLDRIRMSFDFLRDK